MRNFWLEANVDGRESPVTGGPKAKTDGMVVNVYQCDNGSS